MNDKDKIISEDAGIALVDYATEAIDAIVNQIPGLNLAWGLSKALFGAGIKLREKRAMEWVEMIRKNPSIMTAQVLSDEIFQDGFAFALEKYLTERNEEKRKTFRNIFLGFAKAQDKSKFPLEKLIHTLSQLSERDIEVLGDVNIEEKGRNYQIYGGNYNRIENIYNLIGLGLLSDVTGDRAGHHLENSPFVISTYYCKEFVEYLKND